MKASSENNNQSTYVVTNLTGKKPGQIIWGRLELCIIITIIYLFLSIIHIGCPIKYLTGISCPGCGMTRAVRAAILLHFEDAFYYHPLFIMAPIMFLLFLFDEFINPAVLKTIWFLIIILFLGIYIYRLFFTGNDVVVIDIRSGLVLKLLHHII